MKSLTGKFSSVRGWALLLILFLGAGLMMAACGDDEPATTPVPAPAPEPEPEPEPDPPAVPTGLRIAAIGQDFIEWIWTPVGNVSGYDVQYSVNEVFTDEDEIIARTAEQVTYRREGLEPEASGSVRVRSAAGTGDDRITSGWSTHVTGMAMAVPVAPPTPTGLAVSATETSITWTWTAAPGAEGYVVQISEDEVFETMFEGADHYAVTRETSHTIAGLEAETTRYARVAAGVLTGAVPSLDPGDYLLSAWTIHATGMTEAAAPERPPAPANVRLRMRGSDYLEWTWDAVEGASGYQSQFSASSTFPSGQAGSEIHQGMASTTRRVANLDAESDGHLRVRTYTGTLTEPTYGDWSDGHRATTAEPPPAVALDAPEGLRGSAETATSITLTWDEVDDADAYEVRQREPGGAWSDASCGSATADNEVADEECVASGLDSGTDYDFGVRALPANNDRAHNASTWSDTLESSTTGTSTTTPPPTTSGGESGPLNISWDSSGGTITWYWDQAADRTSDYERWKSAASADGVDAAIKCPAASAAVWAAGGGTRTLDGDTREPQEAATPGSAYLLCVRSVKENTRSAVSYAWAIVPTDITGGEPSAESRQVTTAISFGITLDPGFTYQLRRVSTSVNDDTFDARDCSGGTALRDEVSDFPSLPLGSYEVGALSPYTRYGLCYRATNDAGASEWQFTENGVLTLPGRPSAPVAAVSSIAHDATSRDAVWNVATSGNARVPRAHEAYDVKVISMRSANPYVSGDTGPRSPDLSLADCEATSARTNTTSEDVAPGDRSNNQRGFTVTHDVEGPATPTAEEPNMDQDYRVCVRAHLGGGTHQGAADARKGPWVLGSLVVKRDAPASN